MKSEDKIKSRREFYFAMLCVAAILYIVSNMSYGQ